MRTLTFLISGLLTVAASVSYADAIDIPSGVKVTIVVEQQQSLAPPQKTPEVKAESHEELLKPQPPAPPPPPPPPEPPEAEAREPRRLIRYFCRAWKDCEYEKMWWSMTPQYRKKIPLKKFIKLFKDDRENNGGVIDENIIIDDTVLANGNIQVTVDLIFKFKRVGTRRVKAVVEKTNGLYRIVDSPIIPLDMNDL